MLEAGHCSSQWLCMEIHVACFSMSLPQLRIVDQKHSSRYRNDAHLMPSSTPYGRCMAINDSAFRPVARICLGHYHFRHKENELVFFWIDIQRSS